MTRVARPWDRSLWGVRFTSKERSFLLGRSWYRASNEANKGYPGEPTRALLFTTRTHARRFCAEQRASSKETGGVCASWRFKPVRVREVVRP